MTVISGDFVPMNPFTTDSLFVGVGQRYDITIDASQATDNYWFNITYSDGGLLCGSSLNPYPAAIIHYDGASDGLPTDQGSIPTDSECLDLISLSPVVTRTVPTSSFAASTNNTLDIAFVSNRWTVADSTLQVDWNSPAAQHIINNETTWSGIESDNIWRTDEQDQVSDEHIYGRNGSAG